LGPPPLDALPERSTDAHAHPERSALQHGDDAELLAERAADHCIDEHIEQPANKLRIAINHHDYGCKR
jgi:hypothetical protein